LDDAECVGSRERRFSYDTESRFDAGSSEDASALASSLWQAVACPIIGDEERFVSISFSGCARR
jgi:hypothetical protein